MKAADKRRLKEIKKIIKKPGEKIEKELLNWRYCPECYFVTLDKNCAKDGAKTKKITKKDKYYRHKALLKILLKDEIITKEEIQKFELVKLGWKYKDE